MGNNKAAWIPSAKGQLQVDDAPLLHPGPDEVLIENAFVAVNPCDWKIQQFGRGISHYPNILGADVAGVVVEVGSNVHRVKKGDRVMGYVESTSLLESRVRTELLPLSCRLCIGLATDEPKHRGFQLFSIAPELVVTAIPDSLSFEKAVVLPLSLSTAAAGLYQKSFLGFPYPKKDPIFTGQAVLIWGGSSAVGSSAIQLAVASGIFVATTAHRKHFDYVKDLGATHVFDYDDPDVVQEILTAFARAKQFAGVFDAISSDETIISCAQITNKLGGGLVVDMRGLVGGALGELEESMPENVEAKGGKYHSFLFILEPLHLP